MAKIDFTQPVTEKEVKEYLRDASYGYAVADNRVYSRHVAWLLAERERLLESLEIPPVVDEDE